MSVAVSASFLLFLFDLLLLFKYSHIAELVNFNCVWNCGFLSTFIDLLDQLIYYWFNLLLLSKYSPIAELENFNYEWYCEAFTIYLIYFY